MISIIVPVYNVEKYLDKCVESLVRQTYWDIEILLVDDGSPDNCPALCDIWAKKDSRIKVIHKENGGLSSARNAGLDAATGTYIAFVDSDDWVDANTFEVAHHMITSGEYDVASFGMLTEFGTETMQTIRTYATESCNQQKFFHMMLTDEYVYGYACNKLFPKALIGELRFDETLLSCEDFYFCAKYAAKCKAAICTKAAFYHYRQRADSMTGEYHYSQRKLSVIKAYENIMPIYTACDPEDSYLMEKNYLKINLNVLGRMRLSKVQDEAVAQQLRDAIERYYPIVMGNPNNSLSTKLNIAVTKRFPAALLRFKRLILLRKRGL